MFAWWGRTVYRYRFIVIGVMVATVPRWRRLRHQPRASTSPRAASTTTAASRCTRRCSPTRSTAATHPATSSRSTPPPRARPSTIRTSSRRIVDNLAQVETDHPDQILRSIGYFEEPRPRCRNMARRGQDSTRSCRSSSRATTTTTILNNLQAGPATTCSSIDGVDVQLAGLQPLASELTGTIGERPEARRGRWPSRWWRWCCSSCSAAWSRPASR